MGLHSLFPVIRISLTSSLLFMALSLIATFGKASSIGIATGSPTGTYTQFGHDIASLVAKYGVDVDIIESRGSLENVATVLGDEHVHMGLVQSDVLDYIKASNHKVLKQIPNQIKLMFPLYNEEVHLIAKKHIRSIEDLHNKVVGVGAKGSGTNLTSELLFEISNVWPQRKALLGVSDALAALKRGELDAMFFVSGYPVNQLSDLDGDQFHLVSLNEDIFEPYYQDSVIPANTYPWQQAPITTLTVKAVLMTYDFVDERCGMAYKLTGYIQSHLAWLRQNGHPKWQEVDMDVSLPQWERYPCVADFFADGNKYELGEL